MNSADKLAGFTDEALAEELERRERKVTVLPIPLPVPLTEYMDRLKDLATRHLESLIDPDVRCKDTEHYMYEYVMQMFYGPDIFEKFINPNLR